MTANKPHTLTKNRFQLLDHLQENDSPMEVLSEFPQPGKIYQCAVRARSARVKGERRMMKTFGKIHKHHDT